MDLRAVVLTIVTFTQALAVDVVLESLDGSRCYGLQCTDPAAGRPSPFPANLPLYKELPFQVRLTSPAASTTQLQLSVAPPNSGHCKFSLTRASPPGYIHTGQSDPATRPHDARMTVFDDSYELSRPNNDTGVDVGYSETLMIQIASGETTTSAFVRCVNLNETGSPLRVTGPGIAFATPAVAVLGSCKFPSLVGDLQSGHCTEHCKVRSGPMGFHVELGRKVQIQDVSVENRGSCCGRGDKMPMVQVQLGGALPAAAPAPAPTGGPSYVPMNPQWSSNFTGPCSEPRDISGPTATPVHVAQRFGRRVTPTNPNDGPIRTLQVQVPQNETKPADGPSNQNTGVFYCHRNEARFVRVSTSAPAQGQFMVCEVQLKVNYFAPEDVTRLQTVDVKVFPDMWE